MTILIITYILNVIDYLETLYLIRHFGTEVEGNPIMRYMFENNLAIQAKLIIPAVLLLLCGLITKNNKTLLRPIGIATAYCLFLVIHNLALIIQAGII